MHGDFLDFGREGRIGALSSGLSPLGFDHRSSVGKILLNCKLATPIVVDSFLAGMGFCETHEAP
jgi:hypothetical protein